MLQSVKLMLRLLYSVNKNLFYEKWSFLKGKSKKLNDIIYMIYYCLNNNIIWISLCIFNCFFELHSIPFYFLVFILLIKFNQIDNNDWQLYFRDDYMLAIPNKFTRFKMVLIGNFINLFFIKDCIFIYFLIMPLFFKLNFITYLFLFIGFVGAFFITESLFFILRCASNKLKKLYSLVSYIFSMSSMCILFYVIIKFIVSLIKSIDFSVLKSEPSSFFTAILNKVFLFFENISYWLELNQMLLIVISLVIFGLSFIPMMHIRRNVTRSSDVEDVYSFLFVNRFAKRHRKIKTRDDELKEGFIDKEIKLFNYIFKYNYKNFYFSILLDRSSAMLVAIFLNLVNSTNPNAYLLFFCATLLSFTLEISSSVGIKLISNMSFLTDYNTLKLLNTNGIDLKLLVDAKLTLYYRLRLFPTILFSLISLYGLIVLQAPIVTYPLIMISILLIYILYPKIYMVNNFIKTKLDYKNYEKYIEDSEILDYGSEEFVTTSQLFTLKFMILVICLIGSYFINSTIAIYFMLGVTILFALLGYIDYRIMNKIGNNILSFIKGGDYSADIRKIFSKSNKNT